MKKKDSGGFLIYLLLGVFVFLYVTFKCLLDDKK